MLLGWAVDKKTTGTQPGVSDRPKEALITKKKSAFMGGLFCGWGKNDDTVAFFGFGSSCLSSTPAKSSWEVVRPGVACRGTIQKSLDFCGSDVLAFFFSLFPAFAQPKKSEGACGLGGVFFIFSLTLPYISLLYRPYITGLLSRARRPPPAPSSLATFPPPLLPFPRHRDFFGFRFLSFGLYRLLAG